MRSRHWVGDTAQNAALLRKSLSAGIFAVGHILCAAGKSASDGKWKGAQGSKPA